MRRMEQALIFCRTNFDCDNLERFLNSLSGASTLLGNLLGKESWYLLAPAMHSHIVLSALRLAAAGHSMTGRER